MQLNWFFDPELVISIIHRLLSYKPGLDPTILGIFSILAVRMRAKASLSIVCSTTNLRYCILINQAKHQTEQTAAILATAWKPNCSIVLNKFLLCYSINEDFYGLIIHSTFAFLFQRNLLIFLRKKLKIVKGSQAGTYEDFTGTSMLCNNRKGL